MRDKRLETTRFVGANSTYERPHSNTVTDFLPMIHDHRRPTISNIMVGINQIVFVGILPLLTAAVALPQLVHLSSNAPSWQRLEGGIPVPGTNAVCAPRFPPPAPPGGKWVTLDKKDCAGVKKALSTRSDYAEAKKWAAREGLLDEWNDGQGGICTFQLYGVGFARRPDRFALKDIVERAQAVEDFCLPGFGGTEFIGRDDAWYVSVVGWQEDMPPVGHGQDLAGGNVIST